MKISAAPIVLFAVALLAGCAGVRPLPERATAADVRAAWGRPTSISQSSAGERWVYSTAPEGRQVWLLDFDAGGHLTRKVQGLTFERVAAIRNGQTQAEVEAVIGPSYWSLRYPFMPDELVHVYRFMNVQVPSCFYVGYNAAGVVTSTGMQDETRERGRFGLRRPC